MNETVKYSRNALSLAGIENILVRGYCAAHTTKTSLNKKAAEKRAFPILNCRGFLLFLILFSCHVLPAGAVTTTAGTCNAIPLSLSIYLLLFTLVLAVIILSIFVVHYRRRLNSARVSLVNIYLNVKDFVPYDKRPVVNRMKARATSEEFIQIINRMLKRMILLPLVVLSVMPLSAQSQSTEADSVYEFRFVPMRNAFFIPYMDNQSEMQRLSLFVEQYRREITDGILPLHVDGYCNSLSDEKANLAVAKLRSNRVKSELIYNNGLREECFITHNHADSGDFVTVRVIFPSRPAEEIKEAVQPEEKDAPVAAVQPPATKQQVENVTDSSEYTVTQSSVSVDFESPETTTLSLRANLLRWATLTPDLGVEWHLNSNVGILINGTWTSWGWDNKNRRYALWEVAPEVRYYIGSEKRCYVGAMYKVGEFNYKFSTTGKQGDIMGGGITVGYRLSLNRALALDFNLGLGCIHAEYDKYEVIDNVRVKTGSNGTNRWGPISAGVTLTWKLF